MASTITGRHTPTGLRALGLACAVSGVLSVGVGVFEVLFNPGDVPDDRWGYPLTPTQVIGVSVVLAVAHLLQAGGFVGIKRLRAAGDGRVSQLGITLAVVGLVALGVAEVASALIAGEPVDSGGAVAVAAFFGVSSLTFAAGAIAAGIGVIRARIWTGWGRWLVLATGVVIVVLVTPANIAGVWAIRVPSLMLWSALFIPLGLHIARHERVGLDESRRGL